MLKVRPFEAWASNVDGAGTVTPTVKDWRRDTLLTADGTLTNNGTKATPLIYTSTEVTDRKLYTLMHDPQYRVEIARQQTVYNQPAYPSFYLGSDIDWSRVSLPGTGE